MLFSSSQSSIQSRLIVLVLTAVLPVLLFAGLLSGFLNSRQIEIAHQGLTNTIRALSMGADQKLIRITSTLDIVAKTEDFSRVDENLHRRLQNLVTSLEGWTALILLSPDGKQLLNTSRSFGSSLPSLNELFIQQAVQNGKAEISDLRFNDAGEPRISIAYPIVKDSKVKMLVMASLDVASFSHLLMNQELPGDWTAAILDKNSRLIARSRTPEKFVGKPATKVLSEASRERSEGSFLDVTQEGLLSVGAFRKSPLSGWTVVIGVPEEQFNREIQNSKWLIGAGAIFFLALAIGFAYFIGNKISKPVLALADYAHTLGPDSESPTPQLRTSLTEVNQVSEALNLAAQARLESTRKVKEAQSLFETMVNSMEQIAWLAKTDTKEVFFNEFWRKYTGAEGASPHGNNWEFVYPEDLQNSKAAYEEAVAEGRSFEIEHRLLRNSDKTYRWHLVRATPMKNSSGKVTMWVGTATDIHEHKRNTVALETLVEASQFFSSSLNLNETLQAVANVFVPKLADWCSIDLLNKEGIERIALVHPDPNKMSLVEELRKKYPTDPEAPAGAPQVIRTGISELYPHISGELLRKISKDEHHYQLLDELGFKSTMVVPILAQQKIVAAITLIYSDPGKNYTRSDLKFAEELARRAGLAIERARLFEAAQEAIRVRDEFLSIASHELKTPITSLNLQLQMSAKLLDQSLESASSTGERLAKSVAVSLRQVSRLTGLVNDLLDVSKIVAGRLKFRFEEANLTTLLDEIVERFQEQFSSISYSADKDCYAECDKGRLEQVFINIISNAIKYGETKPVEVKLTDLSDLVKIEVKDFGMGIEEEKIPLIFNRYERAIGHSNISGLGLGLYISKTIVEGHHGTIEVESKVGVGSTFIIHIPKRQTEQGQT